MYIVVSYDVNQKTCIKVMKILREKLFHVHNSVFEGEITGKSFIDLKTKIKKIINEDTDKIIFYIISSPKCIKQETLGLKSLYTTIIL